MKKKRFLRTIAMVTCMAAVSAAFAGVALAGNGEPSPEILDKQQEIDKYLFEDRAEEIAAKGITISHTAPMDGYNEIGITPYVEESADYLYEIFGSDIIKVVEGEQAVIFTCGTGLDNGVSEEPASLDDKDIAVSNLALDIPQEVLDKQAEIDKYLFEDHEGEIAAKGITVTHTAPMDTYVEIGIASYTDEKAEYLYSIFGRDMVKVVEGEQAYPLEGQIEENPELVSAEDNAAAANSPILAIVLVGAAVVAAGTAFIMIRRRAAKR